MNGTLRAACYLRISKDSAGDGLGVERQLESCRHLAAAKGWEIDPDWVITENDTSASKGRRPGFERLLRGMETGEVHAVLSYKVDRLMRRMDDMVRLWNVARDRNVLVATVAGDMDLTTPSGRSNAMLWGVIAAIEIDNLRDRLERKAVQNVRAGRNANGGSRPFGWDVHRMTSHPEESRILLDLTERAIAGESLTSLARDLNRREVPTAGLRDRLLRWKRDGGERPRFIRWDVRKVREVLSLERHAGRVTYKGEVVTDATGKPVVTQWQPIIDPDRFDQLQAALAGRPTTGEGWSGERRHLLSGTFLRCGECDQKVTAFQQTSGKWSYRCRGHLSRDRDKVDALVLARVREHAASNPIKVTSWETEQRADLTDQIGTLERRLTALENEFVANGGSAARLARVTTTLEAQLAALRAQRLDRLVLETGHDWAELDLDDLIATSASLLPNDDQEKADRIEDQRNALRLYLDQVVLHPTKVRGRFFDETSIEVRLRDVNRLRWRGVIEQAS